MIFEKVMETIALSEKLRARVRARGGRASTWGNGYGVGVAITVFLTICSSIALQWYAALVASRISTPPTLLSKLLSSIGLWATSQLIISAFLMVMFTYRFEVQLAEFKGDAPTHLYPYAGYPTVEFFKQQNPPACNHRGPPCCPPSGCRMRDTDVPEAASESSAAGARARRRCTARPATPPRSTARAGTPSPRSRRGSAPSRPPRAAQPV